VEVREEGLLVNKQEIIFIPEDAYGIGARPADFNVDGEYIDFACIALMGDLVKSLGGIEDTQGHRAQGIEGEGPQVPGGFEVEGLGEAEQAGREEGSDEAPGLGFAAVGEEAVGVFKVALAVGDFSEDIGAEGSGFALELEGEEALKDMGIQAGGEALYTY